MVQAFGGGVYSLRLGTLTTDGVGGPGVTTYDNVVVTCDNPTLSSFMNGNFSVASGAPWCFTDESGNGSVDYSSGAAVVTGGNDSTSLDTLSFISQTFSLRSCALHPSRG